MYGLVNTTIYGDTEEEIKLKIEHYKKCPMFQGGTIRDASKMSKGKNWQNKPLMATISFFQTNDYSGD